MLVTTYNPDSQASCPICKKIVDCYLTGGLMGFGNQYLELHHKECNTKWRYYINTAKIEILNEE